ncbi:MAG: hypothetical protein K2P65_16700, partial [Lachnospiraceae bacterium]|nr:hypothetical protein [Lachnospiraceae bacterium]
TYLCPRLAQFQTNAKIPVLWALSNVEMYGTNCIVSHAERTKNNHGRNYRGCPKMHPIEMAIICPFFNH